MMSKLVKILVTLGVSAVMLSDASAEVQIHGDRPCSIWVIEYKNGTSKLPSDSQSWLIGVLSGYAMGTNKDILKNIEKDVVYARADKFCHDNPRKTVLDAAVKIQEELIRMKRL